MSGRRVAAGVALAIVLSAVEASAMHAKTTVRLEFTAPPGCPDANDFARRVAERAPHMRRAAEDERARLFRVSVTAGSSGVVGRLVVVEVDGRTSERVLQATDCRQATDALALITALDVERPDESSGANATGATEANGASGATGTGGPGGAAGGDTGGTAGAGANTGARGGTANGVEGREQSEISRSRSAGSTSNAGEASTTSPAARPASPATAPTASQGAATPGMDGARAGAPEGARGAAISPDTREGASSRDAESGGERSASGATSVTWSLQGAIDAFGALGIAPWPSFGGMARVGVAMNRGTSAWSPSLHAGFAIAFDRSSPETGGTATFAWYAGFAELCPLAFRVGRNGRIQPCALAQRGVLEVDGSNVASGEHHPRPWVTVGADARYSLRVVGPLRVEVGVAVLGVIVRQRFQFAPNPAFFTTPPLDGTLFVGAGF